MRRLMNKPVMAHKKKVDMSQFYDSTAYLAAMKEFQARTNGLLKDSDEYTDIRNEIYNRLRDRDVTREMTQEDYIKAEFDSYYINLIVVPEILE